MSASEASRNFSALLDEAEHGETIVVTRNGRRVALIVPAPRANGRALRDIVRRWSTHDVFDDEFADNIAAARETASAELDKDPWRD
ncbi:type II toxin-antitoxin system prevent-host-death family antitoxin [Kibdelosporangium philippinense]|uniref:Antitoxin n=1 Tax=Kibdelosporangium philippinense TaxID=211113 RepID=A0ABS8ZIW8_9PSEU|nr:type II toxin-antitoxin system prevent-host-death family antitoxin [Kibdelosporangium philippinense]MCE7007740.1 type II toxin-antitoxin system prevent-host-death family antitoxin [Kibdelosporangium philippinense]